MAEGLFLLILATLAALGSPGPMTLTLAATGATVGFQRGTRFLVGAILGLGLVGTITSFGAAALISQGGPLVTGFFILSMGYFLFVAFKIATSPISPSADLAGSAPTFLDAIILNLTNPKAYLAFAALYSGFALPISPSSLSIALTLGCIFLMGAVVDTLWLLAGGVLAPIFASPVHGRALRFGFAMLMVIAIGFVGWAAIGG